MEPFEQVPIWAQALHGEISAVMRTPRELSIVCAEQAVPPGVHCTFGWTAIRVAGTLEHSLTGILAAISVPLAEAGVPIFALSSFDTDCILLPEAHLDLAHQALAADGFHLR